MELDNIIKVPTWGIIVFILFLVSPIVTGGIKYFSKDKVINTVSQLPKLAQEQFFNSYSRSLRLYNILFWIEPIGLVALLFVYFYFYQLTLLLVLIALDVFTFILTLEDYLFRKSVIARIKERASEYFQCTS